MKTLVVLLGICSISKVSFSLGFIGLIDACLAAKERFWVSEPIQVVLAKSLLN